MDELKLVGLKLKGLFLGDSKDIVVPYRNDY